jgi:N-acetylmuramoyl-L-alanine amidase
VPEKRLALTYGLLLRDQLESLGATVIMTRDDDSDLSLLERTQITRASGADLFISLHMDGSSSASVGGCSVHYFTDYSRGVAELVYNEMQAVHEEYGNERKRRFRWDPFYVTRISEMPSLLLECGYMTNADDLELLVTPDFQDALMAAVVKGVVAYAQSLPRI